MSARGKARKRALDVLYESDLRRLPVGATLADRVAENDPPVNAYTIALVEGVRDHIGEIDRVISSYARGWTLTRMPAVDRTALRLGVYELLYVDDVPAAVAVSQAVELVRSLSTEESPKFVNGLLAKVAQAVADGEIAKQS